MGEVGFYGNQTLWLIIQHGDLELQKKYIPLLRESVLKGKPLGKHLAMLEDRMLMYEGLPQKYGSQVRRNKETGKIYLHPVENVAEVDKRRAEIGLNPINEYLKGWNITVSNLQFK